MAPRLAVTALLGALVMGCQLLINLDEGTLRPGGEGGSGGGSQASSTSTSSASSGQGGAGTVASASATSSSSGPSVDPNLIDDLEDGDGAIIMQAGRVGSWFTYNDGSAGTQTPPAGSTFLPELIPGGRGASLEGAHTHGSGFSKSGAGLGFDLNRSGVGPKKPWDASAFTGITFWAKGGPVMRFMVLVPGSVPVVEGGTCSGTCGDHFGILINLTQSWVQYSIAFSSLKQDGWGDKATFDPKSTLAVQFAIGANVSFDFWIDDVAFY